jgi:cellulose synthase/poly-beta-1,6-N-acetylglucosamine synthase-like glycosyltransferase
MWLLAFWGSLGLVLYVYLGYPLLVALIAAVLDRRVRRAPCEPTVSILIAAYNEEDDIRQTLENKLRLDYPKEKLEIIVISDGSGDRTDAIVREFEGDGVRLVRQEPRAGKTAALNLAVGIAHGDILAFSDANSLYDSDALQKLVANFADAEVGYVTGRTVYTRPAEGTGVSEGCSTYMEYETLLRLAEARAGSLVGVNGGIDAVRRELYRPMRADQQPDFILPMMVVEKGYRVVFESNAVLRETALVAARDEYKMRVRVSLRALRAIWDMKHLLNPFRYGVYSWQLLSHKVLRYLTFIPLTLAYVSNLLLLQRGALFQTVFLLQTLLYLAALLGWTLERRGQSRRLLLLPYYFSLLNVASAHAFLHFLFGRKMATWNPRRA